MVPPANFSEGRFETRIRLDEPRDLTQCVSKLTLVLNSIGRRVRRPIDRFDHLDRVEGSLTLRTQLRVRRVCVHTLEDGRNVLIACLKLLKIAYRYSPSIPSKGTRHLRSHCDGSDWRSRGSCDRKGTIQPSIFHCSTRRSRFHL